MEFEEKEVKKMGIFDKFRKKKARIDTSIDAFLRRILKGPAYCRIRISQIPELYDALTSRLIKEGFPTSKIVNLVDANLKGVCALTSRLIKEGFPTSKIVNLVDANLKGVCPECGSWYSSEGLSTCGITQSSPLSGAKKLFITRSQTTERILKGDCINPRCSCKEIVICWQVEEEHVAITYGDGLSKGKDPYDVW
jgi:hypothetical protein